ncbi:hypothetical protein DRO55_01505 [Candidatus Bathyarchaeota archaeon]|nr:MAG: hypothetical protein DRO55_01505 [Candidatus Bathyarchaeota archaeon]
MKIISIKVFQMRSVSPTYREAERERHRFIIYFLNDDEDQSVHVEETEEINFPKVMMHLNFGGSVFITHRRSPRLRRCLKRD